MTFSEQEIDTILMHFNIRFKRGMTDLDWREYCRTLKNPTSCLGPINPNAVVDTAMSFLPREVPCATED